ncbi:MAG: glycosyltransferase family 39 protein [Bacteroidetes bacterium]|nr:glycosyltransferase family 39 protein [Bacteroidota bacterium]
MNQPGILLSRNAFYMLMGAATLVYLIGLFIPIMEVDAAQYAAISREMMENHHYLEVLNRGQNYLDKPPLLFWLCAISFKIFGVNVAAYKLPSYLFTLLGVYSVYRLAKHLYDEQTGLVAALILYTCQAFFLFNNDVRTDTLLTANVIFATWQLVRFVDTGKWKFLIAGFAGVGLAMLAKGPIGAIVPGAAIFVHLMMKRQWKKLFQWKWLAGIVVTFLVLLPMTYGLYAQYGSAGPRFFFWTQSFGRITGENAWKNDAGYFYFIHVFGWSMLPWTLIAVAAFFYFLVKTFRGIFSPDSLTEYYSIGGFLIPFVALSLSHYKLPHYIFVTFPLAAIFTAAFIRHKISESENLQRVISISQLILFMGVLAVPIIFSTLWFPATNAALWIVFAAGVICIFWFWFRSGNRVTAILISSATTAITINWMLNTHAYPSLFKYEPGRQLSPFVSKENLKNHEVYFFNFGSYAMEFYTQTVFGYLNENDLSKKMEAGKPFSVVGGDDLMAVVNQHHWTPKKVEVTDHYHITTLSIAFLNPATRSNVVNKIYLLEF